MTAVFLLWWLIPVASIYEKFDIQVDFVSPKRGLARNELGLGN